MIKRAWIGCSTVWTLLLLWLWSLEPDTNLASPHNHAILANFYIVAIALPWAVGVFVRWITTGAVKRSKSST